MTYEEALVKHGPLSEYERGLVDALHAFAWMKDGTYYVGSGMFTLGGAIDRKLTELRAAAAAADGTGPVVLPLIGEEVALFVCVDCGGVEAEPPQAECCPRCSSTRGDLARAVARVERYIAGDYWTRTEAISNEWVTGGE